MKHSTIKSNFFHKLFSVGVWILLWQAATLAVGKEVLLPSPFQTVQTLFRLAQDSYFWQSIGVSLLRIMSGFFLALFCGTAAAVSASLCLPLYHFLYPAVGVMRATPVASFIILALVWIKTGRVPVFISFLTVFPIVWTNILTGLSEVDRKLLECAKVFQFGRMKKIRLVYLPSLRPYFMTAFENGIGIAWKSGIAAEVLCTPKFSVGRQLYQAKVYLETPELFAWTAAVILLSIALETLLLRLAKKRRRGNGHA